MLVLLLLLLLLLSRILLQKLLLIGLQPGITVAGGMVCSCCVCCYIPVAAARISDTAVVAVGAGI
jgi:hypothetical protein